jgi:hypothetical protein
MSWPLSECMECRPRGAYGGIHVHVMSLTRRRNKQRRAKGRQVVSQAAAGGQDQASEEMLHPPLFLLAAPHRRVCLITGLNLSVPTSDECLPPLFYCTLTVHYVISHCLPGVEHSAQPHATPPPKVPYIERKIAWDGYVKKRAKALLRFRGKNRSTSPSHSPGSAPTAQSRSQR